MEKFLVVEDSKAFSKLVTSKIKIDIGNECLAAFSMEDAKKVVDTHKNDIILAILDINLPDAAEGEIIDYTLSQNIPSIVMTGNFNEDMRKQINHKEIIDYIIKEGPYSLDYLIIVIRHFLRNRRTKVLVVDDSSSSRQYINTILEMQCFTIFEANNGLLALDILKDHPDIKLVISDYSMPKMDGFELTENIRKEFSMEQMAVIGISAHENSLISAKFLKKGANDFIIKPFIREEFVWRINQTLAILEYIEALTLTAIRDYLTGLYNRRYLFEIGENLFSNVKRENIKLIIAVIDIDYFKKVNDKYGHTCGDRVLKSVAGCLQSHFRKSDVVSRYGGEEFCIIAANFNIDHCKKYFETLRHDVESLTITTEEETISVTISIGVVTKMKETLPDTINHADECLYKAKNNGRNLVVIDDRVCEKECLEKKAETR